MLTKALVIRLKKSEFTRHVSILATGILLAQAIGLAVAPLVTRLYDPADYALLALFIAIVSSIAPAVAGSYDIAVAVTKEEKVSSDLLVLAFWTAGAATLIVLTIFVLAQQSLKELLNAESLGYWWLLIPIMLFLTAAFTALKYYANRHKRYTLISRVLVTQALFSATLSVSLGVWNFQANGLLITALFSAIFGTTFLICSYYKDLSDLQWWPSTKTWDLSKKYKQFPIYGASTTFLDGITAALPLLILTKFFPLPVVGQYALARQVFSAPLAFIASSVSQVHLRKVAELVQTEPKAIPGYTFKLSFIVLFFIGIPSAALYFFIQPIFVFVFGEPWSLAGEILAIMMPALVIQFATTTVSGVFASTGHLRLVAIWKVFALIVTFIGLTWAARHDDMKMFFYAMMGINLFIYILLFIAIIYATKNVK